MKKFSSKALLIVILCLCVNVCSAFGDVKAIIEQAQNMTLEELAKKAIEESDGKLFYGLGSTSRGNIAIPTFIKYLRKFKPNYKLDYDWQTVTLDRGYDQVIADSRKKTGMLSVLLLQDGVQITNKLVDKNVIENFIPKEWREAGGVYVGNVDWLPLQALIIRTFIFNNLSGKTWLNCWDFVYKGVKGFDVNIDLVSVEKHFLYMLTKDEYADILVDAFDALDDEKKSYFQPIVDSLAEVSNELGLGPNGKYALAWIKLWVENYMAQDDSLSCYSVTRKTATNQFGLFVYSKLRNIEETENTSKAFATVAPYQDGYKGIGGYSYGTYFFVTSNCPLPWTTCAFISYVTCTAEGFSPWGQDIGGYATNPKVAAEIEEIYQHHRGGYDENGVKKFDACNDRGYQWWKEKGNIVIEDPKYCEEVEFTVGSWIERLKRK